MTRTVCPRVSWWLDAPREGFTARTWAEMPAIRDGKFGGLRAVDAEVSAARAWGWPTMGTSAKVARDDAEAA